MTEEAAIGDNRTFELKGARILVVEDEPLLLMELETILLEAGADVVGLCRSVGEALPLVDRGGFDVAVLDFGLGSETAAPIAERLRANATPFCFYTGQVSTDPRLAAWRDCVILQKPAHPHALVAALAALIAG